MPQIDFDDQYAGNSTPAHERLRLRKDEKRRIWLPEKPTMSYVHFLRGPKIENGVGKKIHEKRGDKIIEKWDMDFIGGPFCLGDPGILLDKGEDPVNCPACARAAQSSEFPAVERRFAMNVIAYKMRPDGTVARPLSCECLVWKFTQKTFDKLRVMAREYGGTLTGVDFMFTCESEQFQQYTFYPLPEAIVNAGGETVGQLVRETYAENRVSPEDLDALIGRKVNRGYMEQDLDKVKARWDAAEGRGAAAAPKAAAVQLPANLDDGLNDLFTEPKPGAAPAMDLSDLDVAPQQAAPVTSGKVTAKADEGNVWASILDGDDDQPAPQPDEPTPAPAPQQAAQQAAQPAPASDGDIDFSKLMQELNS